MSAELFDPAALRVEPQPEKTGNPDQRRSARQRAAIRRGVHPLSFVLGGQLPLHTDADKRAEAGKPATGPTCGGCAHRVLATWRNRTYAKCAYGLQPGQPLDLAPLASHGAASDCRRWWPACRHYEPAEATS